MSVIGDDDPNPSLVMCDLWHHWQPVASLASRVLYPPPADVPEVILQIPHRNPCPFSLNSRQVARLTAEATAAWSDPGASKDKWGRALAAYAGLQLLRPQDFEVKMPCSLVQKCNI